jgi:hypothetical protein
MAAAPIVLGITIRADGSAQVQGELNNIRTGLNNAGDAASGAGRQFADMAKNMLAIFSAGALANQILQVNREMQSLRTSLETITGSANAARNAFSDLQKFAAVTPYSVKEVTEAFIKLNNYGLKAGEAQLTSYGNTASAMGKSLNQMVEAVADAASGEFERLKEFGIKASKQGDQVALTFHGITTTVKNSSAEIEAYLQNIGNTNFAGGMERQSKTIDGAISNLGDSWRNLLDTLWDANTEQRVARAISDIAAMINAVANVGSAMVTVGGESVRMGNMLESAWLLAKNSAIDAYDAIIAAWPRTLAALQSAALFIGEVFGNAWRIVKDLAAMAVNGIVGLFVGLGTALGVAAAGIVTVFTQSFEKIKSMAGGLGLGIEAALSGNLSFSGFKAAINTKVKTFADVGKDMGDAFVSGFASAQDTTTRLGDMVDGLGKKIADGANTLHSLDTMVKSNADSADALRKANNGLAAASDTATTAHKAKKEALTEEQKAANALASTYENLSAALLKSIALVGDATATSAMQYDVEKGALSGLTEAKKLYLLQQTAILQNKQIETKANEAAKAEMESLTDQYNKLTLSARDYYATTLTNKKIPEAEQAPLMAQFDKNGVADAAKTKTDVAKSALDAYNKSLDSTNVKTSDLGAVSSAVFDGALGGINLMAGAFDKMVNSITANSKALDENAKMQALNNASADSAEKAANTKKYAKEEIDINAKITNDKLTGVRQMAGAVSSMLTKGSAEQKAAHAIERGIAAWQMAQQAFKIAEYIKEGAVWLSLNATKIAGQIKETVLHAAGALGFVTLEGAKGTAAAATAVAVASQSSPWTGFITGAAMIAAMAAIGFTLMGGGSSAPHVPVSTASPDTGSVLGDTSASSDSVNKTYTLLKDIQAQNYPVLKSIDDGISGLASGVSNVVTRLYQGGGLSASTANLTPSATTLQTVITGVIGASGALSALVLGPLGLLTPLLRFVPILGPILSSITNFFVNGIFGGNQSRKVTGQGIGTDPTSLGAVRAGNNVNSYQYANIETKTDGGWFGSDKYSTAQQRSGIDSATQKAFNDIFKSIGDTMFGLADALGGDLTQRVNDYVIPAMNVELKGLSGDDAAKKMNGVINTMLDNMAGSVFGDVLGQYQKLGEGMLETAVRIASEVAIVKDALASSSITLVDNVIAVSDALVKAAGGLKDFQSQFASYFDKFYSDTEKQTKLQAQLNSQLGSALVVLAASREGYRKQVEAIDITTAAGQSQYSMLLKLSAAADTYYTALDAQTKTYTDAISTAKSNLASAYKSESDAITGTISKLTSFISSLKTLKDSLSLGNLSTGTPLDKYNESRNQLNSASSTIRGGAGTSTASKAAYDAAISGINAKITSFLDVSKTYNASGSGYTADYQQIMALIDSMGIGAGSQQTDAERQLEQLTKSVDGLITINTSVLSVKDALAGVTSAIVSLQTLQTERDKADAAAKQAVTQAAIDRAAAAEAAEAATVKARVDLLAGYRANTPTTIAAGQTNNPYWEKIITGFSAAHHAKFGIDMNRSWDADADAIKQYDVLKQQYLASIPQFAAGGAHTGGWRIVGEHGPELEHTGPSQIFSNSQSKSMLGGGDNKASQEIILELRALRAEVAKLRAEQRDNTGALIQSNYDANDLAADKIVTGTQDTAKQSAWANNSKAVIA